MTHEQKPESAEFRTREAQISAHFDPEMKFHFLADFTEEGLRKELIEAEARGAAEQRRKDAEGDDPKAWIVAQGFYVPFVTLDADLLRGKPHSVITPLYGRPANVTALEDRVKELEAEVERLKTPEWYISQEYEDEADSIADLMECHDPWEIVEIDGYRSVKKVWVFTDAEGGAHQFGTKEEARSAIATLCKGEQP